MRRKPKDVLSQLRGLTEAAEASSAALIDAIVDVMAKPPRERGATTYQLASAIGRSRQQLHQIYRDATGSEPQGE